MHTARDQPTLSPLMLRAGPVTLRLEPATGFIRHLRVGAVEIVRGIYGAVRDRHWRTVLPRLTVREREIGPDSFRVVFDVEAAQEEVAFTWRGTITGDRSGTVRYEMNGAPVRPFLRNRIGLCVLHPADASGRRCTVEHVDGSSEAGALPSAILPHQPFKEIRAIEHEAAPGLTVAVRMEGDVFEMEDQRNWTDASYKTYSTPLELPYPVEVGPDDRVRQVVTVSVRGPAVSASIAEEHPGGPVEIRLSGERCELPTIGVELANPAGEISAEALTALRRLELSHLRVDLWLSAADFEQRLAGAVAAARELDLPLEVALYVTDDAAAELRAFRRVLDREQPRVARWLVYHLREKSTRAGRASLVRQLLGDYDPEAPIGAGANVYFTELNRERPPVEELDFVCFSLNPQVHAFDDLSIVETLPMQAEVVRNAHELSRLPVVVTPVTLRPRFNPTASGAGREPGAPALPADPRQTRPFAAAWTVGSVKYLAAADARSVTYFEAVGPGGVLSPEGRRFPVGHVIAEVGEHAAGRARACASTDPLRAEALCLELAGRRTMLVANLDPEPLRVSVPLDGDPPPDEVHALDPEQGWVPADAEPAAAAPGDGDDRGGPTAAPLGLELAGYQVARLRWRERP